MKLTIETKNEQVEERKVSQEKEVKKILINSIEPKLNHFLFEFTYNNETKDYDVIQIDFRKSKELVLVLEGNNYVKKVESKKIAKIDIFDIDFKPEKKTIDYDFREGSCYITALNKLNAINKFHKLNN